MTVNRAISPEEKLLRLIRGNKTKPSGQAGTGGDGRVCAAAQPSASPRPLPPRGGSGLPAVVHACNSRVGAAVVLAAAVVYFLWSCVTPFFAQKRLASLNAPAGRSLELVSQAGVDNKPYEFYGEGINARQIFASPAAEEAQGAAPAAAAAVSTEELLNNLQLLGVLSGVSPQAVVEDKKAQKTYYLSKGQAIGELVVEDIQEGKIMIKRNNERFELHL